MPSLLPPGISALPSDKDFSLYIHVPYCQVRCGYCDFNTYTATELGSGVSQKAYAAQACAEMSLAAQAQQEALIPRQKISTIFCGGGTPTLLPAKDLATMVYHAENIWGIEPGAEITTEANPDTLSFSYLQTLKSAGFTRISLGMQSVKPHVLKILDRTHTPLNVPQAVTWAKKLGLQVSVDLIYGTPGESLKDWEESLQAALSYQPDHISAYALIIEKGTKLAREIKQGKILAPDPDDQATKYELADQLLEQSGYTWYEISNWSTSSQTQCLHNMKYWTNQHWWGIGPGAHSYYGGVRWWNVKHPRVYAQKLSLSELPIQDSEQLSSINHYDEKVMLEIRLKKGLNISALPSLKQESIKELIIEGLIDPECSEKGKLTLTLKGRLLADLVVQKVLC